MMVDVTEDLYDQFYPKILQDSKSTNIRGYVQDLSNRLVTPVTQESVNEFIFSYQHFYGEFKNNYVPTGNIGENLKNKIKPDMKADIGRLFNFFNMQLV